jgi:hypothetical protein
MVLLVVILLRLLLLIVLHYNIYTTSTLMLGEESSLLMCKLSRDFFGCKVLRLDTSLVPLVVGRLVEIRGYRLDKVLLCMSRLDGLESQLRLHLRACSDLLRHLRPVLLVLFSVVVGLGTSLYGRSLSALSTLGRCRVIFVCLLLLFELVTLVTLLIKGLILGQRTDVLITSAVCHPVCESSVDSSLVRENVFYGLSFATTATFEHVC